MAVTGNRSLLSEEERIRLIANARTAAQAAKQCGTTSHSLRAWLRNDLTRVNRAVAIAIAAVRKAQRNLARRAHKLDVGALMKAEAKMYVPWVISYAVRQGMHPRDLAEWQRGSKL